MTWTVTAPSAPTVTEAEQGAGPASCGDQGRQDGTLRMDCETREVPEPWEARLPDVGQLRAEGTEDRKMEQRERSRAGSGCSGCGRHHVTPLNPRRT